MNVLDIFSGIGGFSLGLERAGMRIVAFCEIEPYCRAVLAKHWPNVPRYDDVRTLTAGRLRADGIVSVDVICGGFPCQDISFAGKGVGIKGARSGLWKEYARLIGEFRPKFAILENVAALLGRGLDAVLGDLAALGYDAEWHCIPAAAVGAPHIRDRVWIIAYPQHPDADCAGPYRAGKHQHGNAEPTNEQVCLAGSLGAFLADANCMRKLQPQGSEQDERRRSCNGGKNVADPSEERLQDGQGGEINECDWVRTADNGGGEGGTSHRWSPEPNVDRMAHGIPNRVDRLSALGNAVVPQIPQIIGEAIMAVKNQQHGTTEHHNWGI